jgi:hypothetical protein
VINLPISDSDSSLIRPRVLGHIIIESIAIVHTLYHPMVLRLRSVYFDLLSLRLR